MKKELLMKNLKSIICLLICIILTLTLAVGCQIKDNSIHVAVKLDRSSDANTKAQKTCIDKYVESFNSKYPKIKVTIDYVNEKPADVTKYDAMLLGADDILYYTNGELEDITKYYRDSDVDLQNIVDSAIKLGQISKTDEIYYQAFNLDRAVVFADKEMLSLFAVAVPDTDWKFSEIADIGTKLYGTIDDGSERGQKTIGFYLPLHMPYVWQYALNVTNTTWYNGEKVLFDGKEEALGGLLSIQELYDSNAARGYKGRNSNAKAAFSFGYVCSPLQNWISNETEEDRALYPSGNYENLLEEENLIILPLPTSDDGTTYGIINTDFVKGFSICSCSDKKEDAAKFALYSLSTDGQMILNEFYGGIPVNKTLWNQRFWRKGILAGENGNNALIGIETDVRDDFTEMLTYDENLYNENMKLNALIGAFIMRDYADATHSKDQLLESFTNFATYANRMFSGKDKTLT